MPRLALPQLAHCKERGVEFVEHALHQRQQLAPDGGYRDAPRRALQQGGADGSFEFLDASAQRGLREFSAVAAPWKLSSSATLKNARKSSDSKLMLMTH